MSSTSNHRLVKDPTCLNILELRRLREKENKRRQRAYRNQLKVRNEELYEPLIQHLITQSFIEQRRQKEKEKKRRQRASRKQLEGTSKILYEVIHPPGANLFSGYYYSVDGITTHFLEKEYVETWKIYSSTLCFVNKERIGLFSLSHDLRRNLINRVKYICSSQMQQSGQQLVNAFKKPAIFLDLIHLTKFYIKRGNQPPQQMSKEKLPHDCAFNGSIDVNILGVEVIQNTKEVIPIMIVKQVLNDLKS